MKRIISLIAFFFSIQSGLYAQVNDTAPNIIPAVHQWRAGSGSFMINASTGFKFKPSALTQRTVAIFWEDLNALQGAKKSDARKNYVTIKITPKRDASQLQKECYHLDIKPRRIAIEATNEADVVPVNKWTQITLTGEHNSCTLFIDGNATDSVEKQFICPLKTIGSNSGHFSASALLSDLKVYSLILSKEEIKALFLNSGPLKPSTGD